MDRLSPFIRRTRSENDSFPISAGLYRWWSVTLPGLILAASVDHASKLRSPLQREEGQDVVEYVLITAIISVGALAIIVLVGPYVRNLFQFIINSLGGA